MMAVATSRVIELFIVKHLIINRGNSDLLTNSDTDLWVLAAGDVDLRDKVFSEEIGAGFGCKYIPRTGYSK
jgi:hypothetical protein